MAAIANYLSIGVPQGVTVDTLGQSVITVCSR